MKLKNALPHCHQISIATYVLLTKITTIWHEILYVWFATNSVIVIECSTKVLYV